MFFLDLDAYIRTDKYLDLSFLQAAGKVRALGMDNGFERKPGIYGRHASPAAPTNGRYPIILTSLIRPLTSPRLQREHHAGAISGNDYATAAGELRARPRVGGADA